MPHDRFTIIITHEHTDFDALAAMLAAHKLYPDAVPVLPRALNRNLRDFLALYRSALPFRTQEDLPRRKVDHAIVVDTQTFATVKGMRRSTPVQIIDHHPLQRDLENDWSFAGGETGATTTLLVEQLAERKIQLTAVEATLMLLGIYEDTGSLIYLATTARDLRAAAWLLERGANLQVANRFLNHPLTPAQAKLYAELAENSRIYTVAGHSVVIASAEAVGFHDEISTLAHNLRDVYDPAGLFLVVDLGDRIQVVARSTVDGVDVSQVARELGGGGHPRAAAAMVRDGNREEVESEIVRLLHETVRPSLTVGQIMTLGIPVTVPPSTTIAEMVEVIQRYGFEGYPVVDGDGADENGRRAIHTSQLRGLITRRQVDRAQHHGLATQTIDQFMRTDPVWVTPGQSLHELQRLMIESNWGQIPVADPETGMVVGIATRTDLINLWGKTEPASQRDSMALRMETGLPDPLLELLQLAGQAAEQLGCPLYAVGGFARDLLLSRPNFDVDLVVEGDAIALARALAREHGGRVRSHKRFGTAKWVLPLHGASDEDPERGLMNGLAGILASPASLDFVTARTEFYAEPTVLPTVEHSSIKLDLHRRDFTINTLAICLTPGRWGELLDFYGGVRDLEEGLIRVLHTHSFVDDPTRILRAVRFEQRFGFVIEQRTQELIGNAVALLDRITPARIRHELELIFAEARPEQALLRLQQFGVVQEIHPDLRVDDWVSVRFERLRDALQRTAQPPANLDQLYFAIWTYPLPRSAIKSLDRRLGVMRSTVALLEDLNDLKDQVWELEDPALAHSQVYRILNQRLPASRWLLRLIEDSPAVAAHLDLYESELSMVRPYTDGQDLKRMGLQPGPAYRDVLEAARDAWLDGRITSEAEERMLVDKLVAGLLADPSLENRSK
ncbi:MAG: CBS domain-containing protein [Caldilineae bacterium]|nr:CBS domain-containing protein [Caldilineae bacterium]